MFQHGPSPSALAATRRRPASILCGLQIPTDARSSPIRFGHNSGDRDAREDIGIEEMERRGTGSTWPRNRADASRKGSGRQALRAASSGEAAPERWWPCIGVPMFDRHAPCGRSRCCEVATSLRTGARDVPWSRATMARDLRSEGATRAAERLRQAEPAARLRRGGVARTPALLAFCRPAVREPHRLPTGAILDPAGPSVALGSMPVAMVFSPDSQRIVAVLSGYREQGAQVIDCASRRDRQTITQRAAFIGACFAPDGRTLFVSGGNRDLVYVYAWRDDSAALADSIAIGPGPDSTGGRALSAGLACSPDGARLYVAENLAVICWPSWTSRRSV